MGEGIGIVLQRRRQSKQLGNVLAVIGTVILDAGQDHPIERKQHHQRPQAQEAVDDDVADDGVSLRPLFDAVKVHDIAHAQASFLNNVPFSCSPAD